MNENDGKMSKSMYLVSWHRPTFSLGCRSQTGSRISSPEVASGMWEMAGNAELCTAEGETWRHPVFCGQRNIVERSYPPSAAAERLPAVVVGASELQLSPLGHARRSSEHAECSTIKFNYDSSDSTQPGTNRIRNFMATTFSMKLAVFCELCVLTWNSMKPMIFFCEFQCN